MYDGSPQSAIILRKRGNLVIAIPSLKFSLHYAVRNA